MNWREAKHVTKKIWNFIWDDDSIWSWILNIVLAFLIIKFLLYPGIGLLLGTNLPVVAVISESMEHNGNFNSWWYSPASCERDGKLKLCTQNDWYAEHNISSDTFKNYPMPNGFNKGDIILLIGTDYDDLQVGDVLVFQSKLSYPVIHRVVEKGDFIQTKGDHNQRQIVDAKLNEKYIAKDQIIGKALFKIPYLGWVKILFVNGVQCITFNGCRVG